MLLVLLALGGCERNGATITPPHILCESNEQPAQAALNVNPGAGGGLTEGKHTYSEDGALIESLVDRGIFSELDAKVQTHCPSWLQGGPQMRLRVRGATRVFRAVNGIVVCEESPLETGRDPALQEPFVIETWGRANRDDDGLPDALDIVRGAKKTVLNNAAYKGNYMKLSFPGGDVPRTEGVCTDVVVRSLRNIGLDLQERIFEDVESRPLAYPMVTRRDPSIDHRRVRTLLPYFQEFTTSLSIDPRDSAFPFFPGDVVFMNTVGDAQPEHMGIVSDLLGASGLPKIINNWTDGTHTSEMDLLGSVPLTHRFRVARSIEWQGEQRGLAGLLRRHGLQLPGESEQILLVTTPLWESSGGQLRRFERVGNKWKQSGSSVPVRVGANGLGQGLGLDQSLSLTEHLKREGDKRAPAGLFSLGTAFGRASEAPYSSNWPYRRTTSRDFWIDDPTSSSYNRWQTMSLGERPSGSAERLMMYSLGLVVQHNQNPIVKKRGSAIFLHPWKSSALPTLGCTAMEKRELVRVLSWLNPEKSPLLLQVAGYIEE